MNLLIEIFTQPTKWNRQQFVRTCSKPIQLIRLGKIQLSCSDNEVTVIDPEDYAIKASKRFQQDYPKFTTYVAWQTGLINLYLWEKQVSWWWFLPFSEKSSLRTPEIEFFYWICILELVLEDYEFSKISIATNELNLQPVLKDLCNKYKIPNYVIYHSCEYESKSPLLIAFMYGFVYQFVTNALKWFILKCLQVDKLVDYRKIGTESVILHSYYPTSFVSNLGDSQLDNVYYGSWSDFLKQKKSKIVYATNLAFFIRVLHDWRQTRQQLKKNNIVILESLWSLTDFLKIWLNVIFVYRYWMWRKCHGYTPLLFRGVDVRSLVLQALDRDVFLKQEGRHSAGVCYSVKRLIDKLGGAKCVIHMFEYQPRDRSIAVGTYMAGRDIPVVGIQVGHMVFNYLAWLFPRIETQQLPNNSNPCLALLPHYMIVYGATAYEVFKHRFQPDTVLLSGPIRYSQLVDEIDQSFDPDEFRQCYDIPAQATVFLLATSILYEESLLLIQNVLELMVTLSDVYLLVKFHPQRPLQKDLDRIAQQVGFINYKGFDMHLNNLIKVSKAVVLATSSVGIDAIALGCMPIIKTHPGSFDLNPLRDYPEAAFFYQNKTDLKLALEFCVSEEEPYQQCKAHWPKVIEDLFYKRDGLENERLYRFLVNQGIFN